MQSKTILTIFCPCIVLFAGLVSCAPDNSVSSSAPFRLRPPVLVREGGDALTWQKISEQTRLEVTDGAYLDMDNNEKSFHLHVKSQCKSKDMAMSSRFTFVNPERIHFGAMVPLEAQLLLETPVNCRFDMMAVNGDGSRHLFHLVDINYKTSIGGRDLLFRRDSVPVTDIREPLRLSTADWSKFSIVTARNLRELALECEYHRLKIPSRAGELVPMAHLDLRSVVGRSESSGPLGHFPRQFCRIVAQYADGARATSPLLQIQFPEIRVQRTALSDSPGSPPDIFRGGVWELKNLESEPIELRLPKPGEQKLQIVINDSVKGYAKLNLRVKFEWFPAGGETAVLAPNDSVKIKVTVVDRFLCRFTVRKRGDISPEPVREILIFDQSDIGPWIVTGSANHTRRTFVTPWERGWQGTYVSGAMKSSNTKVEDLVRLKPNQDLCRLRD